jgi:NADPH-dependent 2,4-dienoyl-CoA reductase/sulfur reductase-like enzyme
MVIDDQPAPGGQIWRSIELTAKRDDILGSSYTEGREIVEAFRASGAVYRPGAQLWQIEPGYRAFVSEDHQARIIDAKAIILATGAQERPAPFPGWTLPGVLTVGAAQILLKSAGQIPASPVWIAGSGPLPLLYAVQLLRAGGQVAGFLDTAPPAQQWSALRYLPAALGASGELLKGLEWLRTLRKSGVSMVKGVAEIEADGAERLEALRYRTRGGATTSVKADTLLVHEGVVPSIHVPLSLDCQVEWDSAQECYVPVLDAWGQSSKLNLFVAGDGAGIGGAKAALLRGQIAALGAVMQLGGATEEVVTMEARPLRRKLRRELAVRPFLDALFRPRPQVFAPANEAIICRCEEVTAGEIRTLAAIGCPGPNQVKAASRAGMGPCQGRQCGYTVTRILAAVQGRSPAEVGFYHIRPPLKPVTLGELASIHPRVRQ